ncbi:MAG: hypothetical protein HQM08_14255 [Candidatus Riflebacteria bacterium]|nr:hypothetical protein [Candidatus Riflebacteria bacterium]
MKPAKPCEVFLDEITRKSDISSEEMKLHFEQCPNCREIRSSIETLRELPSVFPDSLVNHFEKKALQGLEGASVPASPKSPSLPAILGGIVLIGSVFGFLTFFQDSGQKRSPVPLTELRIQENIGSSSRFLSSASNTRSIGQQTSPKITIEGSIPSSENENAKP